MSFQHLSKREAHLEFSHSSLMRQDEAIQDLERKHINAVHQLKEELLDKQHQMEQTNQSDYTLRAERELRQRHEVEFKQMPKQVKASIIVIIIVIIIIIIISVHFLTE